MRRLSAVVLAVLAVTACTDGRTPRATPERTYGPPAGRDRGCEHPKRVKDLAGPEAWTLALPGAWVRVAAMDSRAEGSTVLSAIGGTYVPLGGDPEVAARLAKRPTQAVIDRYTARGATDALRAGAHVYLHRDRENRYDTGYWLRGRQYGVLGDCAKERTAAVAALLGRHAPDYLAAFPGKPSAEIRRMLGYLPGADLDRDGLRWRTVGPGFTPPVVLARLRRARFAIEVAPSWRGNGVVCGSFALGGSGCCDVRDPRPTTLYYDPSMPATSFVLRGSPEDPRPGRTLHEVSLTDPGPLRITLVLDATRVTARLEPA